MLLAALSHYRRIICSPDLMSLFIRGIYLEQSAQKDYFWPLKLGSHISPKCDIAAGTA